MRSRGEGLQPLTMQLTHYKNVKKQLRITRAKRNARSIDVFAQTEKFPTCCSVVVFFFVIVVILVVG